MTAILFTFHDHCLSPQILEQHPPDKKQAQLAASVVHNLYSPRPNAPSHNFDAKAIFDCRGLAVATGWNYSNSSTRGTVNVRKIIIFQFLNRMNLPNSWSRAHARHIASSASFVGHLKHGQTDVTVMNFPSITLWTLWTVLCCIISQPEARGSLFGFVIDISH